MKAVLFLALVADASAPVLTRVEAKIDLATLSISQARDLHGSRQRVRVWRYGNDTEWDGRALVERWHARDVHCLDPAPRRRDADAWTVHRRRDLARLERAELSD
jgi:hypothetical protein